MSASAPIELHKGRLEALSDGVFAVVFTLLVLDLKPDNLPLHATPEQVREALVHVARPMLGYALSFVLVGVFWILQDRKFSLLAHTTVRHAAVTLLFLFTVSLMPFSVSLFIRAMRDNAAATVYFANVAFIAVALLLGWLEARRGGLIAPSASPEHVADFSRRITVMTVATTGAALVAYWLPIAFTTFTLAALAIGGRIVTRRR